MKTYIKISLLFTFLMICSVAVFAQVPPLPTPNPPSPVPLDGGVFTVLGASVAYGAKKLYNKNKQKKQEQA